MSGGGLRCGPYAVYWHLRIIGSRRWCQAMSWRSRTRLEARDVAPTEVPGTSDMCLEEQYNNSGALLVHSRCG